MKPKSHAVNWVGSLSDRGKQMMEEFMTVEGNEDFWERFVQWKLLRNELIIRSKLPAATCEHIDENLAMENLFLGILNLFCLFWRSGDDRMVTMASLVL